MGKAWRDGLVAVAVALVAMFALMATEPDFGMAWDEGYTVRRVIRLDSWFSGDFRPPAPGVPARAFDQGVLDYHWPFSRAEPDGHPPFYAIVGLIGWRITHDVLRPLSAYRFGPMALAALTCGVVSFHVGRRRGRIAGLTAATLLIAMPRSLAHAHYAHYDMPVTCLWLMAQVAFISALRSARWDAPFGILLGLAAATKFTGCFAVVPALAWTFHEMIASWIRRGEARESPNRPGPRILLVALPAAAITVYAVQPPWWIEPIRGPWRFVISNLTRAKTKPLPTMYLGRVYEFSLPWHNTIVWTAVATPIVVLVLAGVGMIWSVLARKAEPWGMVWVWSWLTLMVVRALPNAPGHDGVRLFLPSVASLAVLAGLGVGWIADRPKGLWAAILAAMLVLAECGDGIARTYPYTDSYYSRAIGGLPGAERLGFDATYYWETLGPEFLDWVGREAERRPVGLNMTIDRTNPAFLQAWGMMPPPPRVVVYGDTKPESPDYVQQRRRAFFYPEDLWLDRNGHPMFRITREGVDLLRVYPFEEWVAAIKATLHIRPPAYLVR